MSLAKGLELRFTEVLNCIYTTVASSERKKMFFFSSDKKEFFYFFLSLGKK